jgi:hypothetical protein
MRIVHVRSRRDSVGIAVTGTIGLLFVMFVVNDPLPREANDFQWYASLAVTSGLSGFMVWRSLRLGVRLDPANVVVYNLLRTYRVPRHDVTGFTVGRLRFVDRDAVVLEKTGGEKVVVSSLSLSPYEVAHGSDRVVSFVERLNAALEPS